MLLPLAPIVCISLLAGTLASREDFGAGGGAQAGQKGGPGGDPGGGICGGAFGGNGAGGGGGGGGGAGGLSVGVGYVGAAPTKNTTSTQGVPGSLGGAGSGAAGGDDLQGNPGPAGPNGMAAKSVWPPTSKTCHEIRSRVTGPVIRGSLRSWTRTEENPALDNRPRLTTAMQDASL